jgi:hypothetical protein
MVMTKNDLEEVEGQRHEAVQRMVVDLEKGLSEALQKGARTENLANMKRKLNEAQVQRHEALHEKAADIKELLATTTVLPDSLALLVDSAQTTQNMLGDIRADLNDVLSIAGAFPSQENIGEWFPDGLNGIQRTVSRTSSEDDPSFVHRGNGRNKRQRLENTRAASLLIEDMLAENEGSIDDTTQNTPGDGPQTRPINFDDPVPRPLRDGVSLAPMTTGDRAMFVVCQDGFKICFGNRLGIPVAVEEVPAEVKALALEEMHAPEMARNMAKRRGRGTGATMCTRLAIRGKKASGANRFSACESCVLHNTLCFFIEDKETIQFRCRADITPLAWKK